ncbi:uncharacterized protein KQ657_000450 [Scheffersomyces spartinae]|uniref:Uncharacterized protein n=1 Tax=Scheffersomyces spartinae TaxID=45513 RepID=A0A9P7V9M1_9ASCO|nr:uncharacterized protein KQ657_000450 [Scheffersomyces spartinae]KAG7193759.1 hypothetical protein KQ657_000450 [Scheffersomyces spartinae]
MKFSYALLGLTALASAAADSFGLRAKAAGSALDNTPIYKVDSHPHVFSVAGNEGVELSLTLYSDGTMTDQTGRGVYVDPNTGEVGNVDPFGQQANSKNFGINNGYLTYKGSEDFYACPSGPNKWSLTVKGGCTGGTQIMLQVCGAPVPPLSTFWLSADAPSSPLDGKNIYKVDSHPHVFSVAGNEGSTLYVTLQSDSSLVDSTGRGVYVDPNTGEVGNVDPFGQQAALKGWSVTSDNHLAWLGSVSFNACPSGPNKWSLSVKGCTGNTGIKLSTHFVTHRKRSE